jgi:hypothetical protein
MEFIKQIFDSNDEFKDYYFLVDKIERYLEEMPDISIECCKSLFEGLSKKILLNLTNKFDSNHVNNMPVETVLNNMLIELSIKLRIDAALDEDFIIFKKSTIAFVKEIKAIRNARGDVSHGRNYPKLDFSSNIEAKALVVSSDLFLSKMLAYYLLIEKSRALKYEDYDEFNEWLDEQDSAGYLSSYSFALYERDYIRYEQELQNFYPDLDL